MKHDYRECVCGSYYDGLGSPCNHRDEALTARVRYPEGDGALTYVLGPEGNRVLISEVVFEEEGVQYYFFDRAGRKHAGILIPYRSVEEQLAEK